MRHEHEAAEPALGDKDGVESNDDASSFEPPSLVSSTELEAPVAVTEAPVAVTEGAPDRSRGTPPVIAAMLGVPRSPRPPTRPRDGAELPVQGGTPRSPKYRVAAGKTLRTRRGALPEGAVVHPRDVSGGVGELDALVASGHLIRDP